MTNFYGCALREIGKVKKILDEVIGALGITWCINLFWGSVGVGGLECVQLFCLKDLDKNWNEYVISCHIKCLLLLLLWFILDKNARICLLDF